MLRRNIRQKKEYIYTKTKELINKEESDNKIKIKNALDQDKSLPPEIRGKKIVSDFFQRSRKIHNYNYSKKTL